MKKGSKKREEEEEDIKLSQQSNHWIIDYPANV